MALYTIEGPTPLPASALWRFQRESYAQQGPRAWRDAGVPLQAVSNPMIARYYAEIIAAFLDRIEPADQPVTIVELAAGSGQLGFYLLQALGVLAPRRAHRLIMTDFAERNLEAWAAHPRLMPFVARGVLDFAQLDLDAPAPLDCRVAQAPLADDGLAILIANYAFDSIRHSLWRVEGAHLQEGHVALKSQLLPEALREVPSPIDHVTPQLHWVPTDAPDPLLRQCAEELSSSVFLLPDGALRCLRWAEATWPAGFLLLSTDKGEHRPDQMEGNDQLHIDRHGGCFSLMVNFRALHLHLSARGGWAATAPGSHEDLVSFIGGLGDQACDAAQALRGRLRAFAPRDYQSMLTLLQAQRTPPHPELILNFLRLSGHDPAVLFHFGDALLDAIPTMPTWLERDLIAAMEAVWERVFVIEGREQDVAFTIASLIHEMNRWEQALMWYDRSIETFGNHYLTQYRRAACLLRLDRTQQAREACQSALAINPDHTDSQELLKTFSTSSPTRPAS